MSAGRTHNPLTTKTQSRRATLARALSPLFQQLEDRRMFVAGPVADAGGPYSVPEAGSVTIDAGASTDDNGQNLTYRWDINYSVGRGFRPSITGRSFRFNAGDGPASRTVRVEARDTDGNVSYASAVVTVNNVAPTIGFTGPASAVEGQNYNLAWTRTDPGPDTVTNWQIDWGDDSDPANYTGDSRSAHHAYATDGTYTVTLTATDEDGTHTATRSITVANNPPQITLTPSAEAVDEGESFTVGFASPNRAGTIDNWVVDWGDGSTDAAAGDAESLSHVYADNGAYVVTVTAVEPDGDTTDATASVTVGNVAPTATINGVPGGSTAEGTAVTVSATPADAGSADSHTYLWSVLKDGEAYALQMGTDTTSQSFTFTPGDEGSYQVRVVVTDDDNDGVTVTSGTFAVTNVAPTGDITGEPGTPVDEGSHHTLTATPSDAGADDAHAYVWSVTKGGVAWSLPTGTATTNSTFSFDPTDNGTYVAHVVISDGDGGSVTVDSDPIAVTNVAPTATVTGEAPADEGSVVALTADVQDDGSADTFAYSWTVTRGGVSYDLGDAVVDAETLEFAPTDNGTYVATVVVTDDDGDDVTAVSSSFVVSNVAPGVTLVGPTGTLAEGSSIGFGAPVTDAGIEDDHTYLWTVTRGGVSYTHGADDDESTFAFTPVGNGNFVVTVAVTDDDNATTTVSSSSITVVNVAPVAAVTGTPGAPVNEGSAVSLGSTLSDAGSEDAHAYAWSVTKDGEDYDLGVIDVTTGSLAFTPADEGTYVATLTVSDGDGGTHTVTSGDITVANVNPTATVDGSTASVAEGATISLSADAADVGTGDVLGYAWSVTRDGVAYSLGSGVQTDGPTFEFAPDDDGSYVVTLTVTDGDGGTATDDSDAIVVTNANPTASITDAPGGNVDEGAAVSLGSTVADAGVADTHAYSWSVEKDGNPHALPGGTVTNAASFTFTPADEGTYVVTLVTTDDDNGSVTTTATVVAVNAAPTVVVAGPATSNEGVAVTLTTTVADASDDTVASYAWTVTKDGAPFALPGGTTTNAASLTFTPPDNGAYVASVVVTDDEGASTTATHNLAVANVNPTPSIGGLPAGPLAEGTPLTATASATDVAADTQTYAWTIRRNGTFISSGSGASYAFTVNDNGNYTVSLTATDDDGGTATVTTAAIRVTNAAPDAEITGAPSGDIDEGASVTLLANAADPGADDTLTYAWTVRRNGSPVTLPGVTTDASSLTFVVPEDGIYTATVVVTDDDGASITKTTSAFTALNVAPGVTVSRGGPGSVGEGTSVTYTASVTDVAADAMTYLWSVTKDGVAHALPDGTATGNATFTFAPNDEGAYAVSVRVTDDEGGQTISADSALTVTNVAPTLGVVTIPSGGTEGSALALSATATDPGSTDALTFTWTVTDPDGNETTGLASSFNFTPTDNGDYVVSVRVADADGGHVDSDATLVTVANANPTPSISVVEAATTEGGAISVTFSATDPSSVDVSSGISHAWTITRGGTQVAGGTGTSASYTTTDNGSHVLTVTSTDKDGGTGTTSQTFAVANAAPTLSVAGAPGGAVDEGSVVELTATAGDIAADVTAGLAHAWTLSKGGQTLVTHDGTSFEFDLPTDGEYSVTLSVTDKDGGVTTRTIPITASNVLPSFTLSPSATSVSEGGTITVTPSVSVATGISTYAWSVMHDDEVVQTSDSPDPLVVNLPADGEYVVSLTVTDGDGDAVTQSVTLTANNVAPTVTASRTSISGTVSEGAAVTFLATAADAGDDAMTYAWSVTRGGQPLTLPSGTVTNASTFSFAPPDEGEYSVSVTVADDRGASTTSASLSVTATNVDPTVSDVAISPANKFEGVTNVTLAATATDAGVADGLTYTWAVIDPDGNATELNGQVVAFTPDDGGTWGVRLMVTDGDGGSVTTTLRTFEVTESLPVPTATFGAEGYSEGDTITATLGATDAGADDAAGGHTYAWTLRLGELTVATGTGSSVSHATTQSGTYTLSVTATDNDGDAGTATFTTAVGNVAPSDVSVSGLPEEGVPEGSPVGPLTASANDVAGDVSAGFTYAWSVTHGDDTVASGETGTIGFAPATDGEYTLSVTATDADGASTTRTFAITATNVVPSFELFSEQTSVDEGGSIPVAALVDGETSGLSYAWTVTRGTDAVQTGEGRVLNVAMPTDGEYVVSLTVTDADGDATTETRTLTANNVLPSFTLSATGGESQSEGSTVTVAPQISGETSGLSYAWTVRRGEQVVQSGTGGSIAVAMPNAGQYAVSLTVTDGDGDAVTRSLTLTATDVGPSRPTIGGLPSGSVAEGSTLSLTASGSTAAAGETVTYAWRLTRGETVVSTGTGETFSAVLPDEGAYVVTVTATDADEGSTSTRSADVSVTNVAPTGTLVAPTNTLVRGWAQNFSLANLADVPADVASLTATWNWGDGTPTTSGPATAVQHKAYAANGTYAVSVTLADADGGSRVLTTSVTVRDVGLVPDPFVGGQTALAVAGTSANDVMSFGRISGDRTRVTLNGATLGNSGYGGFARIIVTGTAGNDRVDLSAIGTDGVLFGGSGNDTLIGGNGNDVLVGRRGNDSLLGNAGRDVIVGGGDLDTVDGGEGEDVVVGGNAAFAEDVAAMAGVFGEWVVGGIDGRSFADRVSRLRNGASGLSAYFAAGNLIADASSDQLNGAQGRDWVLADRPSNAALNDKTPGFSNTDDVLTAVA